MNPKPPMFGTWDEMIVTVPAGHEPPPPEWHKWVYGGGRNPLLDIKPIGGEPKNILVTPNNKDAGNVSCKI